MVENVLKEEKVNMRIDEVVIEKEVIVEDQEGVEVSIEVEAIIAAEEVNHKMMMGSL